MVRHLIVVGSVISCTSHKGPVSTMVGPETEDDEVTVVVNGIARDAIVQRTRDGYVIADHAGPIPMESIERVTSTDHVFGALEGLGFGLGIGFALGAGVGFAEDAKTTCRAEDSDSCIFSRQTTVLVMGGIFGIVGGFVGLACGAIAGQHDVWEGGPSPAKKFSVQGPPGSLTGVTFRF